MPMTSITITQWRATFAALALLLTTSGLTPMHAQTPDAACSYSRCALGIIPRLSSLDVVRGDREERVGSLSFLFPHDVRGAFAGSAPAQRHAERALSLRRVAAVLTTVGGVLAASGVVRAAATRSGRPLSVAAAGVGVAAFSVSVPVHFAADAELSRAVWDYNRDLSTGDHPVSVQRW
jgi:hypothetical protein